MTATTGLLVPRTPEEMLHRAVLAIEQGSSDPQTLLEVASKWVEKWSDLAVRVETGEHLDGRSNIYTGETYAQARDRWATYRGMLLDHLRGPDGGGA